MHELSVALSLLEGVEDSASREAIEHVSCVHVRIGALSGIAPDALQFSWQLATAGTIAEGSTLRIEHVPLAIFCDACAAEREPRAASGMTCPACGAASATIVRGRELHVVAMEVPV